MGVVEALMDNLSEVDRVPMSCLVDLVADRIRASENRVRFWPDWSTPGARLTLFYAATRLATERYARGGAQSVVSGKRDLNLRQVQALAKWFGFPMDALA